MRRLVIPLVVVILTGSLPAQDGKPGKLELSEEEKTLLDLTNEQRAKENLPPLKPNLKLFEAARTHSVNMAKQGKLQHVLDDETPAQRVAATGYRYRTMAENLGWGENVPLTVVMKAWLNSAQHRTNLLGKEYTEIGLGYARSEKGDFYCTQVFCSPR